MRAKCPNCGGEIVENDRTFQCEHAYPEKACDFTMWKDSFKNFWKMDLTEDLLDRILADGEEVELTRKSKAGKEYTAKYNIAKNEAGYWELNLVEFVNKN